jgi:hypothetical protein
MTSLRRETNRQVLPNERLFFAATKLQQKAIGALKPIRHLPSVAI